MKLKLELTLPEIKVKEILKGDILEKNNKIKVIQFVYIKQNEYGKYVLERKFNDYPFKKGTNYILFLMHNKETDFDEYNPIDFTAGKIKLDGIEFSDNCRGYVINEYSHILKKYNIQPIYSKDIPEKVNYKDLLRLNEGKINQKGIDGIYYSLTNEFVSLEKRIKLRQEEIATGKKLTPGSKNLTLEK